MKKVFALLMLLVFASCAFAADVQPRKITVGTTGRNLPYSLLDSDEKWTGVEAELWAEVIKRTGWDVTVKRCADMSTLFGELASGRIDVGANCFAITPSRLEKYIASDPIYADAQVIIVLPDSKYKTFEDLRGLEIGCTAGQAAQNTVEKMAPNYDWKIRPYEDSEVGFMETFLGRVPAFAHTVSFVMKFKKEQNMEFRMLDQKLFGNNVGWWFRPDSTELRDDLNKVLAEMQADGTVAKIVSKFMYEDMTQLISDDFLKANR